MQGNKLIKKAAVVLLLAQMNKTQAIDTDNDI